MITRRYSYLFGALLDSITEPVDLVNAVRANAGARSRAPPDVTGRQQQIFAPKAPSLSAVSLQRPATASCTPLLRLGLTARFKRSRCGWNRVQFVPLVTADELPQSRSAATRF
ncbi:hypothetical protein NDU88_005732 [Pleurodeles waltl]|uniref:Uncharacterized protein n=1 Tax=Pleurodeles waltl TaxID=8319 RepID=A0AAV7PJD1_PLEWA|nr:hypothetical protein NDU88_005732 [Pleurodeles waltl]